jgi:hypothetical protein
MSVKETRENRGFDFGAYRRLIETEFSQLPSGNPRDILSIYTQKYFQEMEERLLSYEEGCFRTSMLLGYGKIYFGKVSGIKRINGGFYLEPVLKVSRIL